MAALSARTLLFWLYLLALLTAAASQSSDGPVVTSVSGCVDVGTMTVNCTLPVYLTVRGSGFTANIGSGGMTRSPVTWISPKLQLSAAAVSRGVSLPYTRASGLFPANDTYFVYRQLYLGQGVLEEGVPLTLTVVSGETYAQLKSTSEPFVAVSLTAVAPPTIDSVAGCPIVGADGLSVAQCLPDLHLLTLTGSGFLQWQATPLLLYIGESRTYMALPLGNISSSYILSDSVITVSLAEEYNWLLAVHDFGTPPLAFYFTEQLSGVQSRRMSIQFDTLPPPSYTEIAPFYYYNLPLLPGCVWGANHTTIVNCTAGYSGIGIRGHYLYQTTATVGGQPMSPMLRVWQAVTQVDLSAPLYNFQPGVLYDLVLTSAGGTVTVPNYISFAGTPTIVSAACRDPLLPIDIASLACQVGETVTMNGPYLPPPTTAFTVTVYSAASKQNVSCSNPRYHSEYQLACDMLVPGVPSTQAWDTWYLQWENGLALTVRDRYDAWDQPTAPRIRSITAVGGCGNVVMSSNVTLTGCQGGELLQLYGTHFLSEPFVMAIQATTADVYYIINYDYQAACEQLTIVSDTYATCILPLIQDYDRLHYDTPYMMQLWNRTTLMRSNALFFTIASGDSTIVDPPPSSSSSNLALLVALPVALGVLAVLVVAGTVRQLRSKARSTRRGPNAEPTDVYGEQKEAEQKQAERGGSGSGSGGSGGGWWQWRSRPTLASLGEVRGVELMES